MAINMGEIEARVTVDTQQATNALKSLKGNIDTLESELAKVSKGEVKVSARVDRSMQDAVKLSRDLFNALEQVGKAADSVDAPQDMAKALAGSRQAAQSLAEALEQAGAASGSITAPAGIESPLHSSASAADELATSLSAAGDEAEQLGTKAQSGAPKADSALRGLLGTVKELAPALSAAAVGGTIFSKGWDRLTAIDTAEFKLKGLGHTAESTTQIMDSAMTAVKGTAYGFGDAASLAASAVASGIEPGAKLTRVLTTMADASAISGRSLNEMGAIFNKIAAQGKMQGDELNQLADAGIPVLQLLGEQMGLTSAEVRKLVSEGKVGFNEFEAAMRAGMGGAAQEMGDSIVGSLQNAGAAIGRFGASAMTPFVESGTGAIAQFTDIVDLATSGVTKLGEGFAALPGPVKQVAGAALLAKGAMMALNTEAGTKLQANLKRLQAGFVTTGAQAKKFGMEIAASYQQGVVAAGVAAQKHREAANAARMAALTTKDGFASADLIMQQFGHSVAANMNMATGHMRGFANAGVGVAKTALDGLGRGLQGIVSFMGGPLGLAITAGTLVFGQFQKASSRLSDAQDSIKESAENAAKAQEELRYAVAGTTGALTGEGLVKATEVAKNSLAEFMELGESYKAFVYQIDTDTTWKDRINPFGEGAAQYEQDRDRARELREEYKVLQQTLDEVGVSKEDLNRIVATGGPELENLIASLEASGPAGQKAAEELRRVHNEVSGVVESGRTMPESMKQAAEGLDLLADSSSDAEQKMKGVQTVMQALGLLPTDINRALREQAEAMREIAQEADKLAAAPDLFGADGLLNFEAEAAWPLIDMMDQISDSIINVAANGGDANAELAKWEPTFQKIQENAGLTEDQMKSLREQWGLMDGTTINTLVNLEGADEAQLKLIEITAGLKDVPAGKSIEMKIEDEGTVQALEAIGAKVEDLGNQEYRIALQDTEIQNAMGLLDMLGIKVRDLPNGYIEITDTSETNLDNLRKLGLEPKEWNGRVVIDDNAIATKENIQKTLDGLTTHGKHVVNEERRISYWQDMGYSASEARKIQGPVPIKRRSGGLIPRLAGGDLTHGGYQLPMIGPGTGVTDGILGLAADGSPTAWVDRGEYVTNRAATMKHLALLEAINADDPALIRAAMQEEAKVGKLATGGHTSGAQSNGGAAAQDSTTVGVDTSNGDLGAVIDDLALIEEGATAEIVADTALAEPPLQVVSDLLAGLPASTGVGVTADTKQPSKALTDLDKQIDDLTDSPNEIGVEFDAVGLDDAVTTALDQITDLTHSEAMPTIGLNTEPLEESSDEAHVVLDDLGDENPVPVADMDNDPLLGEVAEADSELHRLGDSKATSVADVDNSSALANIQAAITELNKMPVERVIKIVAHGSLAGLNDGGKVPGLATGGVVGGGKLPTTGPGTNTVDGFLGVDDAGMPLVRVNAGEWVINDKRSAEYDKELELINAGKFPKLDDLDMIPGLFKGGVVSPDQLLGFARGKTTRGVTPPGPLEGSPYVWGGGLLANWGDCSGAMSGLAAMAVGQNVSGRKFATMNEGPVLASMGFRPGLGPSKTSFNIGWFNGGPWGGHTSGTIGGTNVEMGGGRGNGQVGGPAAGANHPQYTDHAWIPLGELVAFDYFVPIPNVSHTRVPAPPGGYSPSGGFGVGAGGNGIGPGGAGVTLHDQGGWLPPGGVAVNHLNKPEPVLNPYQWASFENAVRAIPNVSEAMIQQARAIDQLVAQLSKWSDVPVETAKAWRGLATGDLNAENLIAAGKGHPMMGLGTNVQTIIGKQASDQIIHLAGQAGFAGQAKGALESELVVNIAMSEHTIRAAENLEKAREDEAQAADKVKDAEQKLRDAREKSANAKSDNAKAVRNAEEALAKARQDAAKPAGKGEKKDQAEAARKVRDAEEKLAEARKKQADGVKGTSDDIKEAEAALAEARSSKAKAAARVIEAQTGLQIATVIGALELVGKVTDRIGDSVVGAFEGAASGAAMLTESIGLLGENMRQVAELTKTQVGTQSQAVTAAQAAQSALERLREAERKQWEDSRKAYRDIQSAEFDLRMTRFDTAQVAGAAEVDLAQIRKQGIFDVHAVASAGDRAAIKAASDVAVNEARLAHIRAETDRINFENTRNVTLANYDLEQAQETAKLEMKALEAASYALAKAQAAARGEIGAQTALERYLEGQQKIMEADSKKASMVAQSVSMVNPITWFRDLGRGKSTITDILDSSAESEQLRREGEAMMAAYREQALADIAKLNAAEREMVEKAIADIEGLQGYQAGDIMTGLTAFLAGDGSLMAGKKKADAAKQLRALNEVITQSKYRIEAAALEGDRARDEAEMAKQLSDIEWQQKRLNEVLESWEQTDYLAELTAYTRDILEGHEQENKQLGDISGKLDQRNKSVLMSIGGAGWGGDQAAMIERGTDFGGVAKGDLSLWESMRMESGWQNELLTRMVSPVADTLADAAAANDDGYKERPLGLPDTVVDHYYRGPVEGSAEALRDAARRSQRDMQDNTNAMRELAAEIRAHQNVPNVGTQYTGPVTVNSTQADRVANSLEMASRRR